MTASVSFPRVRASVWAIAAGILLALSGCATGPTANPRDPLEPFNRKMLQFNEGVDSVVLKPVATVYKQAVPPLIRTGVSNFFGNLGDGWSFVNSLLQFKFQNAAENWMRLNVNTFFGLGGLLDIASEMNIERHKEDFGQTLGRWGMAPGPYLMLPLLGPSTLRDALALPIDRYANPVQYVDSASLRTSLDALRLIDARSNLLRVGSVVEEAALDKYSFIRDAYLQKRRAEIFDASLDATADASADDAGAVPETPADDAPASQTAPAGQPSGPAAR